MRRLLAATLAVGLLITGCSTGDDAVLSGGQAGVVAPGGKVRLSYSPGERQAFELSGDDLMHEGQQLSTKDYPGKVVVLNVWGQWCGPCRAEVPELQKVHEAGKSGGWTVLGVDVRDESREAPQDFLRDRQISYPSIFDPPGRSLLALRGVPRNVVPMTVVLDRQHRVANVFLTDLLAEDLLPVVRRLAAE